MAAENYAMGSDAWAMHQNIAAGARKADRSLQFRATEAISIGQPVVLFRSDAGWPIARESCFLAGDRIDAVAVRDIASREIAWFDPATKSLGVEVDWCDSCEFYHPTTVACGGTAGVSGPEAKVETWRDRPAML